MLLFRLWRGRVGVVTLVLVKEDCRLGLGVFLRFEPAWGEVDASDESNGVLATNRFRKETLVLGKARLNMWRKAYVVFCAPFL